MLALKIMGIVGAMMWVAFYLTDAGGAVASSGVEINPHIYLLPLVLWMFLKFKGGSSSQPQRRRASKRSQPAEVTHDADANNPPVENGQAMRSEVTAAVETPTISELDPPAPYFALFAFIVVQLAFLAVAGLAIYFIAKIDDLTGRLVLGFSVLLIIGRAEWQLLKTNLINQRKLMRAEEKRAREEREAQGARSQEDGQT